MNKRLQREWNNIKSGNIRFDKRLPVFAACLFLSSFIWILIALGKDYTAYFDYAIEVVNTPDNAVILNENTSTIKVEVRDQGFSLLSKKMSFRSKTLEIDLQGNLRPINKSLELRKFNLKANLPLLSKQLGNAEITQFIPDTFSVALHKIESKNIPIKVNYETDLPAGVHLMETPVPFVKTIALDGPRVVLDTLQAVATELINIDGSTPDSVLTKLQVPNHVVFSNKKISGVWVNVHTDEFAEKQLEVIAPIFSLKQAKYRLVIYPSTISVVVKTPMSSFDLVSDSDIKIALPNYSIKELKKKSKINITPIRLVEGVDIIDFSPQRVEFLLEKLP